MSDARKLQGDFQEYQESLLGHSEHQQRMLYDRLMQNANVIVLALSFIFLFEMTFVGGVFPEHPSSISLSRYWASLSVLYVANVFLVLALALLLSAIVRFNAPWAVRDDYFPEWRIPLWVQSLAIRYAILRASTEVMQAQERVIKRAKRYIMVGVIVGMASVFVLVFNIWHGPTRFDPTRTVDALNRIMFVAFASSAVGIARYRSDTRDVRRLLKKSEELADGIDIEGGESPAAIVGKAREYQAEFIETSQRSRRFSREFAWLSVNRSCDLNCSFCYANRIGPDEEMPLDVFEGIIEAVQGLGVGCVHLTGGDASGYSHLVDAIGIARSYGMQVVMPTNGLKYAFPAHAFALARAGISQVNVSLKGWDRGSYLDNTGVDGFDLAMEAIRNLKQAGVTVAVSMVLYADSVPDFLQGVRAACENGANAFEFSPAFESLERSCAQMPPEQAHRFVEGFSAAYDELVEITGGNFLLSQTLPLCMWDEALIRKMDDSHQLSSVCQLFDESGLIFDNRGRLLMCNAFHAFPIGTYGKDFADSGTLHGLIMGDKAQAARKKLCSPPSERCVTCKKYSKCAGGCATRWTKFGFEDFESYLYPVLE